MKPGLRLQILLLLGGLLLLAFVPLFFAVATYTQVTLRSVRDESAVALGRAVAGQVAEARAQRSEPELSALLKSVTGARQARGVQAIGIYTPKGRSVIKAGDPRAVESLEGQASDKPAQVTSSHGRALLITHRDARGLVRVVVRADDQAGAGGAPWYV